MARTPKMNEGILGKMWGLLKTIHSRGKFYQAMAADKKLQKYTTNSVFMASPGHMHGKNLFLKQ